MLPLSVNSKLELLSELVSANLPDTSRTLTHLSAYNVFNNWLHALYNTCTMYMTVYVWITAEGYAS